MPPQPPQARAQGQPGRRRLVLTKPTGAGAGEHGPAGLGAPAGRQGEGNPEVASYRAGALPALREPGAARPLWGTPAGLRVRGQLTRPPACTLPSCWGGEVRLASEESASLDFPTAAPCVYKRLALGLKDNPWERSGAAHTLRSRGGHGGFTVPNVPSHGTLGASHACSVFPNNPGVALPAGRWTVVSDCGVLEGPRSLGRGCTDEGTGWALLSGRGPVQLSPLSPRWSQRESHTSLQYGPSCRGRDKSC